MSGLLDEWNSEINTTEQLRQSSTVQSAGVIGPSDALFGLEQRAEFLCRCVDECQFCAEEHSRGLSRPDQVPLLPLPAPLY